MPLTDEQRRANKVAKIVERYRCLQIHKCINDTAKLFQKLVRLRAIEPDGKLTCVTCGIRRPPGDHFDSGHWIGRSAKATIFDERNCHAQCSQCNQYPNSTVRPNYDAFMRQRYGDDVLEELKALSRTVRNWTREELAELRQQYLDEIREMDKGPP